MRATFHHAYLYPSFPFSCPCFSPAFSLFFSLSFSFVGRHATSDFWIRFHSLKVTGAQLKPNSKSWRVIATLPFCWSTCKNLCGEDGMVILTQMDALNDSYNTLLNNILFKKKSLNESFSTYALIFFIIYALLNHIQKHYSL